MTPAYISKAALDFANEQIKAMQSHAKHLCGDFRAMTQYRRAK
jgi:hypothetical protein